MKKKEDACLVALNARREPATPGLYKKAGNDNNEDGIALSL